MKKEQHLTLMGRIKTLMERIKKEQQPAAERVKNGQPRTLTERVAYRLATWSRRRSIESLERDLARFLAERKHNERRHNERRHRMT